MNKNFESQRAKLTKEMTSREFINLLRETLAHIRCGHTNVSPDPAVPGGGRARLPMLPLRVNLEGTRLFVLLNESAENQTIVPGMEILEINGKKVRDIIALVSPKMPADGDIESGKRVRIQRNFPVSFTLFVDQSTDFTIKARDPKGTEVTATLPGVLDSDRSKNQNSVNRAAKENLENSNGLEKTWQCVS